MKKLPSYAWLLALLIVPAWAGGHYVQVPGGSFRSDTLVDGRAQRMVAVAPFRMRSELVTQREFLAFTRRMPRWQRGRVPSVFATGGYLSGEDNAAASSAGLDSAQPAVWVSWFAARAFCASEGARLPHWIEWEYAAAADTTRRDARDDASWQARKLARLNARFGGTPATRHDDAADVYGLRDMHVLVAEWVDDYAAMFVDADARNPGDSSLLRLCGGAAAAFASRTDYTLMMRVATLAALKPADSSANVGFRCVKDDQPKEHA